MARIEGVSESETNDDVRQIFEELKKRHGFVSNTAKIFALRPTVGKVSRPSPKEFRSQGS